MNPVAEAADRLARRREARGQLIDAEVFHIVNEETRRSGREPGLARAARGTGGGAGEPHAARRPRREQNARSPTAVRPSALPVSGDHRAAWCWCSATRPRSAAATHWPKASAKLPSTLFEQSRGSAWPRSTAPPDAYSARANRRYCEITGYDATELVTRSFESVAHPEDLATRRKNMRALAAGLGREIRMERRYLYREDGGTVWVDN
ncbi:MAG: PAS domain S-box protein [Desulfobacterales bacterium]|nr:PAS domain S-box protein [Desulfobacterales bacterium]